MALCSKSFAFVLAMFLATSSAVIICPEASPVSVVVGQEASIEQTCTLPEGNGCHSYSVTGPALYTYAATPIVGESALDVHGRNFKQVFTFRGFDNMLHGQEAFTRSDTYKVDCITAVTREVNETHVFNVTMRVERSASHALSLVPPTQIPVGCLVENVETQVTVNFAAPNTSATYRSLVANWKLNDDLPWVLSRPQGAQVKSSRKTVKYDAGAQQILRKIEAVPDSNSLKLLIRPPQSSGWTLRGSDDASWKVCIYPGDGFNYFKELCTEEFPVRRSQDECDALPASGAISVAKPAVGLLISALLLYVQCVPLLQF